MLALDIIKVVRAAALPVLILKRLGPRESPLVIGAHSRCHDGRFFRPDAARRFGLRGSGQRLDAGTFECLMVGVIFSEPGHSIRGNRVSVDCEFGAIIYRHG
jgi:hypothetical protein